MGRRRLTSHGLPCHLLEALCEERNESTVLARLSRRLTTAARAVVGLLPIAQLVNDTVDEPPGLELLCAVELLVGDALALGMHPRLAVLTADHVFSRGM